ncbi:MAG: DUF4974 domain-containing protein [Bacteroides sp.]|nr:DUF4974 domain-containing protein [Bacteroides sp.]
MKNETDIKPTGSGIEIRQIDRLLDNALRPEIDNSRIKNLVKDKIAQERSRQRRRRILWSSISSAAAILIIVMLGIGFSTGKDISLSTADTAELMSAGYKELKVPRGKRMEIDFSDGTHLVANNNTRVVYPEKFTGKERKIFVDGEVYVDVARDESHPFIVESPGFEIKVLGTKFNIDNHSDSTSTVVLVSGSIDLSTSRKQTVRLKPNDLVDVVNGEISELRKVDAMDYISWVKGLITLHGESMTSLIKRLEDYYGVTITCDPVLSEEKIYGKLDLRDSLNDVLSTINNIVPMKIMREGNVVNLKRDGLN